MQVDFSSFKKDLDIFLEEVSETNNKKKDLLESLASLEHDQWVAWAKDILETEDISEERAMRWKKLFVPYEELSDEMKELDREWAHKVLKIVEN